MSKDKCDLSRRRFLSKTAIGLTGAGLAGISPGLVIAEENETPKSKVETAREIIYRKLGRKGPKLPIISMGAGSTTDPGVVQASYELGVRHFDTAATYQFGRNEQMIGKVINRMGVRDKAIIGSKITAVQDSAGMSSAEIKKKVFKMTNACLRRLKTDYIDIFYIHDQTTAEGVNNPSIIEALAELKHQKKIILAGTTTHTNMTAVINETIKHDIFDVVLTSINFTMKDDTDLLNAIKAAADKGLGVIAMKTQAGGARFPDPESRRKYSGSTIMTAALKWVMRNENIITAIPGFNNYEFMKEDFSVAYNLEYTDEEKSFLKDNKAVASIGFCRQCRKCLASCPNDIEIPTLMRTHMYAAQYASFDKARSTLESIPHNRGLNACSDCSTCVAQCSNTVDIPGRIAELKLIYS